MMEPEAVAELIKAGMPNAQVTVTGDGSHFDGIVISSEFAGKSPIQRQRMVYATVNEYIADGRLHALSFKTYTPEENQS